MRLRLQPPWREGAKAAGSPHCPRRRGAEHGDAAALWLRPGVLHAHTAQPCTSPWRRGPPSASPVGLGPVVVHLKQPPSPASSHHLLSLLPVLMAPARTGTVVPRRSSRDRTRPPVRGATVIMLLNPSWGEGTGASPPRASALDPRPVVFGSHSRRRQIS